MPGSQAAAANQRRQSGEDFTEIGVDELEGETGTPISVHVFFCFFDFFC